MDQPHGGSQIIGMVTAVPKITFQDNGATMTAEVNDGGAAGFLVHVQTHDELDPQHHLAAALAGRTVRVTVEVLDGSGDNLDDHLDLIGERQAAAWRSSLPAMPTEMVMQMILEPIQRQRVLTTVTPPLATVLLARYVHSRPMNYQTVDMIVRRLQSPDPEGEMFEEVRVARDGRVFAGQHLLYAVVRSRVAAPNTPIVLGADRPPWLAQT